MTTISAKTILSSQIVGTEKRLSTILCRYPRWIHAEGRTHRLLRIGEDGDLFFEPRTPSLMEDSFLSRNASSSRAIPVEKMIQDVIDDPAIPLFWGKNQKGMQAAEETDAKVYLRYEGTDFLGYSREQAWLEARNRAIEVARAFADAGYHKQIVNRLLEPFSHINVLVSATEWSNFLALRDHEDAEPHIRMLAQAIRAELEKPPMQYLHPGEWHMPFVEIDDWKHLFGLGLSEEATIDMGRKLSVARCASTSYKTVDGFDMTPDRAIALHDKLIASTPLHASPAEHVAQADQFTMLRQNPPYEFRREIVWRHPRQHGNFVGFRQYRKMLPNECL